MSRQGGSQGKKLTKCILLTQAAAILMVVPATRALADPSAATWTSNGAPTQAAITGGPWTLEQSGAANGLKSSGYCDSHGNQIGNPGTQRMSPYYFPVVYGQGLNLQGFFDWRPKDTDEAVVAAQSLDGGQTWTFQSKVLELRTACPTNVNAEADGDASEGSDPNNSDNVDDDGQGHQYAITIGGQSILYTLNRSSGHIDSDQLVTHLLSPTGTNPLNGVPALDDGPTDELPMLHEPATTTGLLNPDGILAAIPGTSPLIVIYEQKILNGDKTDGTALPASEQCAVKPKGSPASGPWASFYAANGGLSPNNDITYLRLATTTDGINFTDMGSLQGLNDPTTVSVIGTRWVATAGTVLQLPGNRWGLFFSGGNCVDADSDAFHYVGYAESTDLIHWTVINGLNNPIASVAPVTVSVGADGAPVGDGSGSSGGTAVTIPSNPAVVGDTQGFFTGRVYGPSVVQSDQHDVTMMFAGYHTQKPKNGLGDYRNIGRVSLHSSRPLLEVGPVLGFGGH
jgi:hypothetical protein